MKKVLAIIAIVMLIPFTAFGMEMMADTAMDNVTGQAGVSIGVDDIDMDMSIDHIVYGDADGYSLTSGNGTNNGGEYGEATIGGYVSMDNFKMLGVLIDKLTDYAPLQRNTAGELVLVDPGDGSLVPVLDGTAVNLVDSRRVTVALDPTATAPDGVRQWDPRTGFRFLTIDVATFDEMPIHGLVSGDTAVIIGLPTLRVSVESILIDAITLGSFYNTTSGDNYSTDLADNLALSVGSGKSFGAFAIMGVTMDMFGGEVAILAH